MEVRAWGGDARERDAAIDEAFGAIAEVDRLMSNYREDSELTRVNRTAASAAVPVSAPLFSVLASALDVSRRSNGAFDVTIGPLVKLWGFHDRKPHVPTDAELAAIRPLVDYRKVLLDNGARTVRFSRSGIEIDLGGIAKGFAVELAAGALRQHRLPGFIDAGGNEYMLGPPLGKRSWTIGIRDPDRADGLLGTVEIPGGSVSTSAEYANYLTAGGRKYGHILDPRSLRPSDASLSVTVIGQDGTLADAVSTTAFVLGPERGLQFIDSMPGMSGVIAYRAPDGRVRLAMSASLRRTFRGK